ncbi:MAG: 3-isopropylmalate dehydratase small subunit [Wenzhouxiangellaceae bacterium]|nr:3-isopropylmalate dehydratase small subunit [Wenzhouxiangellaceae bacterium]
MKPMTRLSSETLVLSEANIDTDQIIPARFLTTTSQEGLGQAAFADWRFDEQGRERPDCVLNGAGASGRKILVAGENFGCGSSREHAVWALRQFGIDAVLSPRIADIFRANALKNGLLAVEIDLVTHQWLIEHPGAQVSVDVDACQLSLPHGRCVAFDLDPFARVCLLEGVDALGYLIHCEDAISGFERQRAARQQQEFM